MADLTGTTDPTRPGITARRRVRDAAATRQALLDAARVRFARDGYDRTGIRDIARDVGVDQALVIRYFGNKQQLFDEARADLNAFLRSLTDPPVDTMLRRLLERLLGTGTATGRERLMLSLLCHTSGQDAREWTRQALDEAFTRRLVSALDGPDAAIRADLILAWLIGISVLRDLIGKQPLATASVEDVRPAFDHILAALLPELPHHGSPTAQR